MKIFKHQRIALDDCLWFHGTAIVDYERCDHYGDCKVRYANVDEMCAGNRIKLKDGEMLCPCMEPARGVKPRNLTLRQGLTRIYNKTYPYPI